MINLLNEVEVVEQQEMTKMPQKAASAWSGALSELLGAKYRPIAYVGNQVVKGINHVFIAEQTFTTANPVRHIVTVTINEFGGKYSMTAIERLF